MSRIALLIHVMACIAAFMVACVLVGATGMVLTLAGVCVYVVLAMCMVGVWDSRAQWHKRTLTHGTQVPTPMGTLYVLPRRVDSNIVVSCGEDFSIGTYTKEDE